VDHAAHRLPAVSAKGTLQAASARGYEEVVQLLLNGADVYTEA